MVLPLAAVLAAQLVVHANASIFGWARIVTAGWALLYVVLGLDPNIRDKIDTASQLVDVPAPSVAKSRGAVIERPPSPDTDFALLY